jgi:hypothetical protein
MTKPLVAPDDAEHLGVDFLTAALAGRSEDVTCGVNVPSAWAKGTKAHVQVALDGTPTVTPPVWWATLRVTCWHESTTEAKRLARLVEGLLLAHSGDGVSWAGCLPGTGVLPAKDPDTKAQLASITVRMKLRGRAL